MRTEFYKNNPIYRFDLVKSTNETAKEMVKSQAHFPFFVIAEEQWGGKGRMGKKFFSPKSAGIYFTAVLKQEEASEFAYLTTRAALAVCLAVENIFDIKPRIKWVNDIFIDNKKIGGILAESTQGSENNKNVILGIGINCEATDFPTNLRDRAASLADFVKLEDGSKDKLIYELINQVLNMNFLKKADFLVEYKSRSMLLGKKILISANNSEYYAYARDISENGGLIIEKEDNKLETLISSDISIKIAE